MSDRTKELHELIEEAREEDLPLLSELLARFQHPLDFAVDPVGADAKRRQELILEAHLHARSAHLTQQHIANTAKRLGLHPELIEFSAGGSSIGQGDVVEMTSHWLEGSTFCRLNTFRVENQEIITLDRAELSNSRSELIYQLRVLTPHGESKTRLNVPL